MEVLKLPDNIKIHYAGSEVMNQFIGVKELGVSYSLYTAFPFVAKKIFGKTTAPIMPLRWMKTPSIEIPKFCAQTMKHCIQDSGLFTLMFGSMSGKHDEKMVNKWYDNLVEFTMEHNNGATCVEVDCQKILGVEKAWEFRERMKKDLPNRIINVFHLEDGPKGLDRMIEFSDYIAISVPELRKFGKKNYTYTLAKYIKSKKPNIDIHLLGCTEKALLSQCKFCTSCDSTSYISGKRFGYIKDKHISRIKTQECINLVGEEKYNILRQYNNEQNTNFLILSIEYLKQEYQKTAGNQDYYYNNKK